MKKIVCTLSVGLLMAGAAMGDIIDASVADAQIVAGGAGDQGSAPFFFVQAGTNEMRVGRSNAGSGRNATTVIPFLLPDLGAVADPFLTSSLSFNLNSIEGSTTFGADLYGLASRTAATVLTADFYMGTVDDPSLGATKLQDNILTSSTTLGAVTSDDITTWLNGQYDSGAGIGEYVFLRISAVVPSSVSDANRGYNIAAVDSGSNQPTLTYTAIPEPSTMGMVGLGTLITLLIRRRRRS